MLKAIIVQNKGIFIFLALSLLVVRSCDLNGESTSSIWTAKGKEQVSTKLNTKTADFRHTNFVYAVNESRNNGQKFPVLCGEVRRSANHRYERFVSVMSPFTGSDLDTSELPENVQSKILGLSLYENVYLESDPFFANQFDGLWGRVCS